MNNKEQRRQKLLDLEREFKTLVALAKETGTSAAHLSQIKNGTRKMGDAIARQIEQKLEKAEGWMDTSEHILQMLTALGADKDFLLLVEFYKKMSPERQHELVAQANTWATEDQTAPTTARPFLQAPALALQEPKARAYKGDHHK